MCGEGEKTRESVRARRSHRCALGMHLRGAPRSSASAQLALIISSSRAHVSRAFCIADGPLNLSSQWKRSDAEGSLGEFCHSTLGGSAYWIRSTALPLLIAATDPPTNNAFGTPELPVCNIAQRPTPPISCLF